RNRFPAQGVAEAAGDPLRPDHLLRRAGQARGKSQSITRRGFSEWKEPDSDRDPVPSRDRRRWRARRIRRRSYREAETTGAGEGKAAGQIGALAASLRAVTVSAIVSVSGATEIGVHALAQRL